jgi:hypothetical protein
MRTLKKKRHDLVDDSSENDDDGYDMSEKQQTLEPPKKRNSERALIHSQGENVPENPSRNSDKFLNYMQRTMSNEMKDYLGRSSTPNPQPSYADFVSYARPNSSKYFNNYAENFEGGSK